MAQSGSALDWGSRGHRFKSCCPDHDFHSSRLANLRDLSCDANLIFSPLLPIVRLICFSSRQVGGLGIRRRL